MNFSDPEKIAHSANLLVCIGGLATSTGIIAGAGAVVGGYLSYREIRKRLPAATRPLAEELERELATKLAEPGLNEDTRRLIPQMIEASLPSPQRVMEAGQDSATLVEMMAARLTDREHLKLDHLAPFKRIVGHLLDRLLADPQFAGELAPAFRKQILADAQSIKTGIESLEARFGSLSEALSHVGALGKASRDQLEALASRFEIDRAFAIGDADLRALLEAKAEEYRAYKAQIDLIDERTAGLGNLKAAAQDAADRLDLEEVENLLSMVHATELDIAAQTAELRADNALLRGRVDEAYWILSATADSFAAVDPVEPVRRRYQHMQRLYHHGIRFGGRGINLSEKMTRDAITRASGIQDVTLWAVCQNALAASLQEQGIRDSGITGTNLLSEAVDAYNAAMSVLTEHDQPVLWADTKINRGNALQRQGIRTGGPDGTALIAEAIDDYRAALRVHTERDYPEQWALAQNNLGAALYERGTRTGGPDGAALIAEAVDAYRAALRVHTERDHPMDWAMTQNNLANALRQKGTRTEGPEGGAFLAEGVDACRAALRVYTEKDHPMDWAMTQNNLANALMQKGTRTGGPDGAALLSEAVDTCRAALRARTEKDHPVDWAITQETMALAEEALANHETCTDPQPHLEAALDHLDAALRVHDPVHTPYNFQKATASRARIQAKLDAL